MSCENFALLSFSFFVAFLTLFRNPWLATGPSENSTHSSRPCGESPALTEAKGFKSYYYLFDEIKSKTKITLFVKGQNI